MATRSPFDTRDLPALVCLAAGDGQAVGLRGDSIRDLKVELFERSPRFKALLSDEALRENRPISVPGLSGLPMTIKHLERLVSYYEFGVVTGLQYLTPAELLGFAMLAQHYDGWYTGGRTEPLKAQVLAALDRIMRNYASDDLQSLLPVPEDQRFSRDEQQAVDITLAWTVGQQPPAESDE